MTSASTSKQQTKPISFAEFKDKMVSIITCDGRNIVGTLKGLDQQTNVVLSDCHERVYSQTSEVEQEVLGLYIIRGQNVGIIGILDEETENKMDLKQVRGENCNSIVH
mmetsp:Transcript_21137/g.33949  ORF Transcript_21137/g.33949 Transcript_21137/m.33949 type:complete len:108 (+) Transcript_21137:192-515(+)